MTRVIGSCCDHGDLTCQSRSRTRSHLGANVLGEPIHPNRLRDAWAKVAAEAGLRLRFHDLRHAHASLLLQQGVHPKVVSERLGHSTVGVTLDIYSHVVPGLQAQIATQLEELLANG